MSKLSPYRSLPSARRLAVLIYALNADRGVRDAYVRRLVVLGGGFRAETLKKWPVDQLAKEIIRRGVEGPQDELQLLLLLYVEIEPVYQTTFLEATGVPHDGANIADDLPIPFADAATVKQAAESLIAQFGDEARAYLRTIALDNGAAWPGLAELVAD
jgi:hypothetical protein